MSVLILSPHPERISKTILASGLSYFSTEAPPDQIPHDRFEWLISFGYRHILPRSILDQHPNRAINIHISLLPWNRGADPNFWSWFDNTPKGVTIHQITKGTDTGPILAQSEMPYLKAGGHTLRSSYEVLMREATALFAMTWPRLTSAPFAGLPQRYKGTYHRKADITPHMKNIPGWDASCEEVERMGERYRARLAA